MPATATWTPSAGGRPHNDPGHAADVERATVVFAEGLEVLARILERTTMPAAPWIPRWPRWTWTCPGGRSPGGPSPASRGAGKLSVTANRSSSCTSAGSWARPSTAVDGGARLDRRSAGDPQFHIKVQDLALYGRPRRTDPPIFTESACVLPVCRWSMPSRMFVPQHRVSGLTPTCPPFPPGCPHPIPHRRPGHEPCQSISGWDTTGSPGLYQHTG